MKKTLYCECEKPIPRERAEAKGVSESFCGRCERPLALRVPKRAA